MEVSNYIKMRDQMQERFLTYDQKEIEGKYGFAFDDDYFYVPYLFEEWRTAIPALWRAQKTIFFMCTRAVSMRH